MYLSYPLPHSPRYPSPYTSRPRAFYQPPHCHHLAAVTSLLQATTAIATRDSVPLPSSPPPTPSLSVVSCNRLATAPRLFLFAFFLLFLSFSRIFSLRNPLVRTCNAQQRSRTPTRASSCRSPRFVTRARSSVFVFLHSFLPLRFLSVSPLTFLLSFCPSCLSLFTSPSSPPHPPSSVSNHAYHTAVDIPRPSLAELPRSFARLSRSPTSSISILFSRIRRDITARC